MGYTTEFEGRFDLNEKLDDETYTFIHKLSDTRRMKRKIDPKYGIEGEFYVEDDNLGVIDSNEPPSTQPGLWFNWVPTEDKMGIEWNGMEKFYEWEAWLNYLIENILEPKGYVLNGQVTYQGEDEDDWGVLEVVMNKVSVYEKESKKSLFNQLMNKMQELEDADPFIKLGLSRKASLNEVNARYQTLKKEYEMVIKSSSDNDIIKLTKKKMDGLGDLYTQCLNKFKD